MTVSSLRRERFSGLFPVSKMSVSRTVRLGWAGGLLQTLSNGCLSTILSQIPDRPGVTISLLPSGTKLIRVVAAL